MDKGVRCHSFQRAQSWSNLRTNLWRYPPRPSKGADAAVETRCSLGDRDEPSPPYRATGAQHIRIPFGNDARPLPVAWHDRGRNCRKRSRRHPEETPIWRCPAAGIRLFSFALNCAHHRHFGFKLGNRCVDSMDLTLHLQRDGAFANRAGLGGFSLDSLCEFFGVAPPDRHTAGGDAFITAQIFLRLPDWKRPGPRTPAFSIFVRGRCPISEHSATHLCRALLLSLFDFRFCVRLGEPNENSPKQTDPVVNKFALRASPLKVRDNAKFSNNLRRRLLLSRRVLSARKQPSPGQSPPLPPETLSTLGLRPVLI